MPGPMRFVVDGDTPNDFFIWALAENAETAATQLAAAATIPAIAETQAGASVANLSITRFIPNEQTGYAELARRYVDGD
jgi:hypothetical protein